MFASTINKMAHSQEYLIVLNQAKRTLIDGRRQLPAYQALTDEEKRITNSIQDHGYIPRQRGHAQFRDTELKGNNLVLCLKYVRALDVYPQRKPG